MNKSYHGQKEVDSTKISDKISQQKGDAVFTSTPSVKPTSTPTPSPTPKTVVTLESQTGVNYVYSVQNASSVQVELQVTGDNCWTQVNQGNSTGAQIIQQIFLNGTLQKWEDPNGLWIRLGKPLAAQIKINGVQINIPEKVNPINLQINLK
ncbi:MAG: hypothetical protein A2189_01140 [Paenibacillus sp. RIFOXYA1_FULL_44_5]|nr:MAG: hypothetical protein A2189_01140 [Paenibacillus sp. RIFOXYA1_FULL_44_5]